MPDAKTPTVQKNTQFQNFCNNNPYSKIVLSEEELEGYIENPWGDSTLIIKISDNPEEKAELESSLNNLVLPEKYSALFHTSTKEMEFIWTAFSGPEEDESMKREFIFNFGKYEWICGFSKSSDSLINLAKYTMPKKSEGSSSYRNMLSYHIYSTLQDEEKPDDDKSPPYSFWVKMNNDFSSEIDEAIHHLNAYMAYFDRKSPLIKIHEKQSENNDIKRRERYRRKEFPTTIVGTKIDDNLLAFYNSLNMEDNIFMRYLLSYRILEYASYGFASSEARLKLRRLISKPDFTNNLDKMSWKISEVFAEKESEENIPRIERMIKEHVDDREIWSTILENQEFFKKTTRFDGGFNVQNLIGKKCGYENWEPSGIRNTVDRLRSIRNALSHGRDSPKRGTIHPSSNNAKQLIPWLNIVEVLAGDVMLMSKGHDDS